MNLSRPNSPLHGRGLSHAGRRRIIAATVAVLLLFLVDSLTGGKIRSVVRMGGSILWGWGVSTQAVLSNSGFFATKRGLINENAVLTEQIAQLQEQAAAYRVIKQENAALSKLLHVASMSGSQNKTSGITAPIVSSFRASPYGTFQVGAGSADAVSAGDLVLSYENFVIARIEQSDEHISLAKEIFAPNVSSDAVLRGVGVVVVGQGGGNAKADVPRQTNVVVGDPVVSSVLGSRAIGIVGKVSEDSGSAFKRVHIYLPVNLFALQFVYIVKR
jgi:cell shape-determining protein MreC